MLLDQITNTGRRHFMKIMSGIGAGFLITDGKRVSAAKKDIKQMVEGIETERILRSHPKRNPEIQWKEIGDCAVLNQKDNRNSFCKRQTPNEVERSCEFLRHEMKKSGF